MQRLTIETLGATKLVVRRHFAASPEALYRAHTEPDLVQQWLTGPDGWRMTECQHSPDGKIRYDWADDSGASFYLTGQFLEQQPPHLLRHVERMHLPDPTPENLVETRFNSDGSGGTDMVMTMQVPDAAIRQAMLGTGMADGMEQSYQRLDRLAL